MVAADEFVLDLPRRLLTALDSKTRRPKGQGLLTALWSRPAKERAALAGGPGTAVLEPTDEEEQAWDDGEEYEDAADAGQEEEDEYEDEEEEEDEYEDEEEEEEEEDEYEYEYEDEEGADAQAEAEYGRPASQDREASLADGRPPKGTSNG